MNASKDRRLIEALDYIDEEYISSAAAYKMSYQSATQEPPKMTWRTPFKHWKQFVALAACLILLAFASPIVNYVVEAVRSFAAGWGSADTETLEEPETTNGMYDEYILTEEDLAQINEAYFQYGIADLIEDGFELSDEEIEQRRNSKYSKFAQTVDEAMRRNKEDRFYFGKFGECFIFKKGPGERPSFSHPTYILGEYRINVGGYMWVAYYHEWMSLSDAYERGLLLDEDVEKLYEVYCNYYKGDNENEEAD